MNPAIRACTRPDHSARQACATRSGLTPARTRPARMSFATACLNACQGPHRSSCSSSVRIFSIDALVHWTCSLSSRKNARPFASSRISPAFRVIMSATAVNVSSSFGISRSIWRLNFSCISSTSAISSASFDVKCQYTAPFVIPSRDATSVSVVRE